MNENLLQLCQMMCSATLKMNEEAKQQFLYDILYHNFDSVSDIGHWAERWNIDLNGEFQVCVAGGENHQGAGLENIKDICEEFLDRRYRQSMTAIFGGQVVMLMGIAADEASCVIKENMQKLAERLEQGASDSGAESINIGIGRKYQGAENISRSFQEAKQSILLANFVKHDSQVTGYDELGILKLLSHIALEEQDDFYHEVLGKLLEYDNENESALVHTLEIYYLNHEDLQKTAEQLFMHTNTLRKRLKKIEEILGGSLENSEMRVKCYLACQIGRILQKKCL